MDDKVLLAALRKLHARTPLPASQLTAAQRRELDRFARQTGAVSCQRQGRGDCYLVANPVLFITHLTSLSPGLATTVDNPVPPRARHIADARDSKAGVHRHPHYYLLLKAVGEELVWREANRSIELPLGHATP